MQRGRNSNTAVSRLMSGAAGLAVVALLAAGPARAQTPATDLATIQQQLNALRNEYEARIRDLEVRLKAAEDKASVPTISGPGPAPPIEVSTTSAAPDIPAAAPPLNATNPGISVVLNGNYVSTRRDTAGAAIPGFPLADEAGLPGRGASLGESEVTFAANVDPYLTANLTVAVEGEGEIAVEEAFLQTTGLGGGLTVKGGRFFSGIGYLNERHAHNWSFIDMPLPYRAFLGGQYGDDGVQVRWLAPAPFFLEFGGELYRGDGFPGGNWDRNGPGAQSFFVHAGGDFGAQSSWLGALSYIHTNALDRETGGDLFTGDTGVGIASAVYKWAPGGNVAERNLTFSGEYFLAHEDGEFNGIAFQREQHGWYAQSVYQFARRWSAGLRYSQLNTAGTPLALTGTALDGLGRTPSSVSGLLEFDSSEFSRFRLQYNRDRADLIRNDEWLFQYTVVFGPHGAHRY